MSKNDGGPAFPQTAKPTDGFSYCGMSLRDYFAANAPEKPGPWFEPILKQKHKSSWLMHCPACDERKRELFIQWPYAWADAMLTQRSKP